MMGKTFDRCFETEKLYSETEQFSMTEASAYMHFQAGSQGGQQGTQALRESCMEEFRTHARDLQRTLMILWAIGGVILIVFLGIVVTILCLTGPSDDKTTYDYLKHCSEPFVQCNHSLLDVQSILYDEFIHRQTALAQALVEAGVNAFIAEPSASSTYYANISSTYELSERPFLVVIDTLGDISYLVPKFEVGRISALPVVYNRSINVIE